MNKNDKVTVAIEDFTKTGEGIGRSDGYTLFVKNAVIGDQVSARITRPKKNYAYARVDEILVPSPDRVEAVCENARRCGGCALQEYDYGKQLLWKRRMVSGLMKKIGGFTDLEVRPVIGMEEPFRYRNKAQYPIRMVNEAGLPRARGGFFAGRTHKLIPVDDCCLTGRKSGRILQAFTDFIEHYGISVYDEESGHGLVRHLLIREGFGTGEIMVCPVINGRRLPHTKELISLLTAQFGVRSVCLNVNTEPGNTILGRETLSLFGNPWITDTIGGLIFRISPVSFYQVNPVQTLKLYTEALLAADLTGEETVFDLYCGIGTISLFLARQARQVFGVEIVPDAVGDARINAQINGIRNAQFFTGAAEKLVDEGFFAAGVPCPHPDVVILDPPRKGCDRRLIEAVLRLKPDRIVYVSCDPATLARDLQIFLQGNGRVSYMPQYIQPVDMFPMTVHVETVCLLSRQDG